MAALGQAPPAEFALYRRVGVRRAGVACAKGAAYGWPRIAALNRRSGVRIGYLCHGVTARADDDAAWRREVDVLRDAVRAASSPGAPLVYATSGGSGALSWEEAAERVAARLGPLAAEARTLGVHLSSR
jgi:sugar phosphate isomerase/epimerase